MPGILTYSQIIDTAVTHTNRADKRQLAKTAVNLAIMEVAQRHQWRELFISTELTLNTGEYNVTVPGGLSTPYRARMSGGPTTGIRNLKFQPLNVFRDRYPTRETMTIANSTPSVMAFDGTSLQFDKAASSTMTVYLEYIKTPTLLVVDTDVCELSGIDNALIAWTTRYIFQSIQETTDAQIWASEFERSLLMAVRSDSNRPGEDVRSQPQGEYVLPGDPLIWDGRSPNSTWGSNG